MRSNFRKVKLIISSLLTMCVMMFSFTVVKAEESVHVWQNGLLYSCYDNQTAMVKNYANAGDASIDKVDVPKTISYEGKEYMITSVDAGVFHDARYLKEITIPDTVTEIGASAFEGCKALETINLPSGLKMIPRACFARCTSLKEIEIPDRVEAIDVAAFCECTSLKKIEMPNSITSVGNNCFQGCSSLEEVIFSDNVENVSCAMFSDCVNLKKVTLPKKLKEIDIAAFAGCVSLEQLTLPNGLQTIGSASFVNCDSLKQLVIPESVKSASYDCINGSDNLKVVFYPDDLKDTFAKNTMQAVAKVSYTVNADGTVSLKVEYLPEGMADVQLPADIGGREIASVTGSEGVDLPIVCTKHRFDAYSKDAKEHWCVCSVCKKESREAHVHKLDSVTGSQPCVCGYVPFTITEQPTSRQLTYAYKNGSLAVTVKATFGKEKITYQWTENGKAIAGATASTYTIPTGKTVGSYVYTCKLTSGSYSKVTATAIVTVQAPAKGKKYKDDNNKATYKVTNARTDGKGTVEYVKPVNKKKSVVAIPATVKIGGVTYKVTSIAKNAFKNNKYIKRLTIEKNVEKIGARAFYGCKKLKNITIKTTKLKTKKIGTAAFEKTPLSAKIKVPKKKLKAYKTMLLKKGVSKKAKIQKK